MPILTILWEYRVTPAAAPGFEALYGPDGDWARLFRRHAGYLGTELLRDVDGGRYLSIDRWRSAADYDDALAAAALDYAALDARGDALTLEERPLGRFLLAD